MAKAKKAREVKAIVSEKLNKEIALRVTAKIFKDVNTAFKATDEKKRVKTLNEARTLINALKTGDERLINALVG